VYAVAFSADGTRLAAADGKAARVWDLRAGEGLMALEASAAGSYVDVAFSPDGERLVTGGNTARIWSATTGELLRTLREQVHSVAFSADGERLATVSSAGVVRVWDAETGVPVLTLAEPIAAGREITDIAFSPDGSQVATVTADLIVRVLPYGLEALLAAASERPHRRLSEEECQRFLHVTQCPQ